MVHKHIADDWSYPKRREKSPPSRKMQECNLSICGIELMGCSEMSISNFLTSPKIVADTKLVEKKETTLATPYFGSRVMIGTRNIVHVLHRLVDSFIHMMPDHGLGNQSVCNVSIDHRENILT
jgi:hypothetical protein